jgi:hypothetical protein
MRLYNLHNVRKINAQFLELFYLGNAVICPAAAFVDGIA